MKGIQGDAGRYQRLKTETAGSTEKLTKAGKTSEVDSKASTGAVVSDDGLIACHGTQNATAKTGTENGTNGLNGLLACKSAHSSDTQNRSNSSGVMDAATKAALNKTFGPAVFDKLANGESFQITSGAQKARIAPTADGFRIEGFTANAKKPTSAAEFFFAKDGSLIGRGDFSPEISHAMSTTGKKHPSKWVFTHPDQIRHFDKMQSNELKQFFGKGMGFIPGDYDSTKTELIFDSKQPGVSNDDLAKLSRQQQAHFYGQTKATHVRDPWGGKTLDQDLFARKAMSAANDVELASGKKLSAVPSSLPTTQVAVARHKPLLTAKGDDVYAVTKVGGAAAGSDASLNSSKLVDLKDASGKIRTIGHEIGNEIIENVDTYAVSHAHADHVNLRTLEARVAKGMDTTLVCTKEVQDDIIRQMGIKSVDDLPDNLRFVREARVGDYTVSARANPATGHGVDCGRTTITNHKTGSRIAMYSGDGVFDPPVLKDNIKKHKAAVKQLKDPGLRGPAIAEIEKNLAGLKANDKIPPFIKELNAKKMEDHIQYIKDMPDDQAGIKRAVKSHEKEIRRTLDTLDDLKEPYAHKMVDMGEVPDDTHGDLNTLKNNQKEILKDRLGIRGDDADEMIKAIENSDEVKFKDLAKKNLGVDQAAPGAKRAATRADIDKLWSEMKGMEADHYHGYVAGATQADMAEGMRVSVGADGTVNPAELTKFKGDLRQAGLRVVDTATYSGRPGYTDLTIGNQTVTVKSNEAALRRLAGSYTHIDPTGAKVNGTFNDLTMTSYDKANAAKGGKTTSGADFFEANQSKIKPGNAQKTVKIFGIEISKDCPPGKLQALKDAMSNSKTAQAITEFLEANPKVAKGLKTGGKALGPALVAVMTGVSIYQNAEGLKNGEVQAYRNVSKTYLETVAGAVTFLPDLAFTAGFGMGRFVLNLGDWDKTCKDTSDYGMPLTKGASWLAEKLVNLDSVDSGAVESWDMGIGGA